MCDTLQETFWIKAVSQKTADPMLEAEQNTQSAGNYYTIILVT
jgi:hypothetical protein